MTSKKSCKTTAHSNQKSNPVEKQLPLKPCARNYLKELRDRRLKNWKRIDSRSHPLSHLYISEIQDASKIRPHKKDNYKPKDRAFDPLLDDEEDANTDLKVYEEKKTEAETETDDVELDPLTLMRMGSAAIENTNPLFKQTSYNKSSKSKKSILSLKDEDEEKALDPSFVTWKAKRNAILKKYTTNKRLAVTANFLDQKEDDGGTEGDQLKKRVEQLEMSKQEDQLYVSQTEYIKRMEHNVKRLRKAWNDGKRVLSLKIAIQSSKLLNESSVTKCPQFYPSMFVLIADILDSFGELVFERLKLKAIGEAGDNKAIHPNSKKNKNKNQNQNQTQNTNKPRRKLRHNFTPLDVTLEARETCQNWFYKIACIRELSPRLFIELALFRCWQFIRDRCQFPKILHRLSTMIRGIGDPLVAAYARAYLVHVGFTVLKDEMRPVILEAFDDFLYTFNQIEKSGFKSVAGMAQNKIEVEEYIDLYTPCLDWIIQCIGYHASEEEFFALVQRYKEGWNNSIILLHILAKFDNKYISKHAKGVSRLIKDSFVTTIARSELYLELGRSIVNVAPPEKHRLSILNEIWKVVAKIKDAQEYVEVASVYVEYLLQHFGFKEIDILLADVIKHLKKDLAFEKLQPAIFEIVSHVLKYIDNFKDLFTIMNFLPLIDMLESSHKLTACKMILESFRRNCNHGINDPVLINSLMDVSRMLHDSVDYLTFEDEKRQVTSLINHLIDYIDYGHDLERQLNEYLDCRAMFSNLDGVIYNLVTKVGALAMKAHTLMKGHHNKKTGAFVKACLAYCHVTIPSLESLWPRMYLFSNLGQIALTNQMITQAEAFFIAAINLIPKLPTTFTAQYSNTIQSTPKLLSTYIATLSSTLLLMPGHPKQGPFYLVTRLIKVMGEWQLWAGDRMSPEKTMAYLHLFRLFATLSQKEFPYKIRGVDSNDVLFAQSPIYLKECYKHLNSIGKQLHQQLLSLKSSDRMLDKQAAGTLAIEYLNMFADCTVVDAKCTLIIVTVYKAIILKARNLDKKYKENTLKHIQNRNPELWNKLQKTERVYMEEESSDDDDM